MHLHARTCHNVVMEAGHTLVLFDALSVSADSSENKMGRVWSSLKGPLLKITKRAPRQDVSIITDALLHRHGAARPCVLDRWSVAACVHAAASIKGE